MSATIHIFLWGMICDDFMGSGHPMPTLTWGCVWNPHIYRQNVFPGRFEHLIPLRPSVRKVPHTMVMPDPVELCALRNFRLMAHFEHLSST